MSVSCLGNCLSRHFAHFNQVIIVIIICYQVMCIPYMFWILTPFKRYMVCKHFLTFPKLPVHFSDCSLYCEEGFEVDVVPFIGFGI